jgi:TetR/AcrR family tetracycline transcriptional repressor
VPKPTTRKEKNPREAAKRGPGRPPKISRELILEIALEGLYEDTYKGFSLRKLAARLGVAPGAIYTYFADKEELLAALADQALPALWVDLDHTLDWKASLQKWMYEFRAALVGAAGLKDLIALRVNSPALLSGFLSLGQLLESAGLSERDAAHNAQHLIMTVCGFVFLELDALQPDLRSALTATQLQPGFERLTQHVVVDDYNPLYDITVRNTLAGIEHAAKEAEEL